MNQKAFTLLELLVVLACIALVLGILLPSLREARAQGQSMLCLSKLRQCSIAASAYTACYDGFYPMGYQRSVSADLSCIQTRAWDYITTTEWQGGRSIRSIEPGILWERGDSMEIQQCPSYRGSSNAGAEPFTGYNYNTSYIGHGSAESIPQPARYYEVTTPAYTALFGDGEYGGGANKFMRAPWANPGDLSFNGRYAGTQGFRHRGRTNVAFCDGRAESAGDCYTQTYPEDRERIAEGTGFLSPDNRLYDLK
jgi:prepilin-type processing-associated H-X9-DG protein/prepilin-type N-terminal cleavage/methylation domain-containing protein